MKGCHDFPLVIVEEKTKSTRPVSEIEARLEEIKDYCDRKLDDIKFADYDESTIEDIYELIREKKKEETLLKWVLGS